MYHKINVKRFSKNIERLPLIDAAGSEVVETYLTNVSENIEVQHLDERGMPYRRADGTIVTKTATVSHQVQEIKAIIPDYRQDKEFVVYQHTDETGAGHIAYYMEDGTPFSFVDNLDEYRYEYEIVEKNAAWEGPE